MIKLAIFDFDGTLVDTAADLVSATNEFLVHHGQKPLPADEIRQGIGTGLRELLFKFFHSDPDKENFYESHFLKIYDQHHLLQVKVYAGFLEFLKVWPHQVAILSNKSERFIHSILKHLELDRVPWVSVVGGDTYAQKKPHPLPFEKILEQARVEKTEAIMVGDGEPDILGAKNAGIKSVAVEYGYCSIDSLLALGANYQIKDLHELHSLLVKIP